MIKSISIIILLLAASAYAQTDDRWLIIDDFGRIVNDDLLARVDNLQQILLKRNDADAIVVLYGPRISQYINQRRIEGCDLMRKYPKDSLKFVFGPDGEARARFYLVTKDAKINVPPPDYVLPDLRNPIEMSNASVSDEFCPVHFDLEWYSHFMVANPSFRGKVVIDSSLVEFRRRVVEHGKALATLGVDLKRVHFVRQRFAIERDEQWWLIPGR